ncbi:GNAT family N-acetyltransferase [Methylovirgula sp. 4M-Z18]|nr:GNAT family N-acetyltransferase [Methylovirgula sp. 4M-Z18]
MLQDLYAVLRLRQSVFIVEQQSIYPDIDGYDDRAMHLIGRIGGEVVAYARVFPPGVKYAEYAIGRVAVAASARNRGLGRAVMTEAMSRIFDIDRDASIRIQAQAHLTDSFYRPLGFACVGPPYDEDGILHVDMVKGLR